MLSQLHPLPKLVMALIWIFMSVILFDLQFQLTIIACAAGALIMLERRPVFHVLALMVPFALFGSGFLTTTMLFRQEAEFAVSMAQEQFSISPWLSAGLVLFFRTIACGMISAVFGLTTDPGALVKALMMSWRLPAHIGLALFQALQLVPDLGREAQQIRLARAMERGRTPTRIAGPLEGLSLVVPLLAFSVRRAGRSALAMETRGLVSGKKRTCLRPPVLARRDAMFVAISSIALSANAAAVLL